VARIKLFFGNKAASGGATTYTATASLSAAIQQAQAATASLQAAIQAPQFVTSTADAAIAQARTASADLQAAIQQARSATSSADAAIVAAMSLEASLDAYIQALAERYARPDADVRDGDWLPSTPGDLYAMLDEETASDTDYIYTTTASTCVIRLSDVADPGTSAHHVLRYRVKSAEGSTLVATLKQGATTIATRTHSALGTDWNTLEMNLSGAETDAISDYTDLTVTFTASDGVTWTPLELFASSEVGVWYDPSDFLTMWKDTAGTTPVTAVDDLVARIDDKSGNGFHATQATEANRPVLKQDGNGNYYLLFDGTNDGMVTSVIDFTSTDEMSVFAGMRKLSDAAIGYIVDHNSPQSSTNAFAMTAPQTVGTSDVSFRSRGSGLNAFATYSSLAAPVSSVLTGMANIFSDVVILRSNGVQVASSSTDQGTGNYVNAVLSIGKRPSGNFFNGQIYSVIVRGVLSTSDEIDETEAWVNGKTEAY